jgi:3-mercaptopyruvate sulfurtransferase SseA
LYLVLRECFPVVASSSHTQQAEATTRVTPFDAAAIHVDPKNYDGSMWQWADDAKAPMVVGNTPSGNAVEQHQGH